MAFIQLTKIDKDTRQQTAQVDSTSDTDEPGENAHVATTTGVLETTPMTVNPLAIRCVYPRKDGRDGSRLTFTDGGGLAVTEPYETIKGMIAEATGQSILTNG